MHRELRFAQHRTASCPTRATAEITPNNSLRVVQNPADIGICTTFCVTTHVVISVASAFQACRFDLSDNACVLRVTA